MSWIHGIGSLAGKVFELHVEPAVYGVLAFLH
jgi:hypothetical protein